ncbi:hypothetical protein BDA96_04G198500 [Sorghum bicolor]|uniref:Uncharacterized protein n=1 Tax=Sorghum bicolor TaxID=4558 RepID=A0A921UIK7_SORBI|nr:hypothetical protein BDA96_04G198500 [Sorghum bicolor]
MMPTCYGMHDKQNARESRVVDVCQKENKKGSEVGTTIGSCHRMRKDFTPRSKTTHANEREFISLMVTLIFRRLTNLI